MKYIKIVFIVLLTCLVLALAFKPLSKLGVELYLGYKLKAPVTLENYQLFPLSADIYVATMKLGDEEFKDVRTNLKRSGNMLLTLSSFKHKQLKSDDLRFDYNISSGDFDAKGDVEIVGFDSLNLQTQGNYQEDNLSALIKGTFTQESDFDFVAKLNQEGNVTKVDLDANTFGGVLELAFVKEKLTLLAKSMQLSKIFKELKQEPIAQGDVNLQATLDIKTLHTQLSISSKEILAFGQKYEDVKFDLKEFSYKENDLSLNYGVDFTQNEKHLHFDGSANYKKKLQIQANTKDFGGAVVFNLDDTKIKVDASNVSAQNILLFLGEKPFMSANLDLHAKGDYKEGVFQVDTPSFGGETKIILKNEKLYGEFKKVDIRILDKMFLQKNILKKGALSGKLFYDIKGKKGSSALRVDNAIVSGVDLDAKLGTLMNAMGLNIFSLKDELFGGNEKVETKIKHLEFDIKLRNKKIYLVDAAFKTPKFRIAALGNLMQSGKINELNLNLLDENGCSIIKQDISGTLSEPILENKILTTADVVVSIPGEVLKSPKKLLDISTNVVDKTATFLLGVTHLSDSKVTVTSDIKNRVANLVDDTSKIVLKECKVVYDGKVKAIKLKR